MGPGGADRSSPPVINRDRYDVAVVGVHNYTVIRADPTTRRVTVEFIDRTGNRVAGSFWSHDF